MTEGRCRDREDVPKKVASVIAAVPTTILRVGLAYLRMKRRVRKNARVLKTELLANGVPEHVAQRLSMRYKEDARFIRVVIKMLRGKGSVRRSGAFSDNHAGN
ncbi:MAG: hypothetical protein JSV90_00460 [Methanobacteriota archaeon]|nr:MAG: hypothetical protein JSV90_00460 [Euryarchaeota archaeon]